MTRNDKKKGFNSHELCCLGFTHLQTNTFFGRWMIIPSNPFQGKLYNTFLATNAPKNNFGFDLFLVNPGICNNSLKSSYENAVITRCILVRTWTSNRWGSLNVMSSSTTAFVSLQESFFLFSYLWNLIRLLLTLPVINDTQMHAVPKDRRTNMYAAYLFTQRPLTLIISFCVRARVGWKFNQPLNHRMLKMFLFPPFLR